MPLKDLARENKLFVPYLGGDDYLELCLHTSRTPGSVAELCEWESPPGGPPLPQTELAARFDSRAGDFFATLRDANSSNQGLLDRLEVIYGYWRVFQSHDPTDPSHIQIKEQLQSFDSFWQKFAPADPNNTLRIRFHRAMSLFMRDRVHTSRVIQVPAEGTSVYSAEGDWVEIPRIPLGERRFVDKPVLDEVINFLTSTGLPASEILQILRRQRDGTAQPGTTGASNIERLGIPGFFHATGSAALPGIENDGALHSSTIVDRSGGEILTGEFATTRRDAQATIPDVFVDEKPNLAYTVIRWFNEFPVFFGVTEEAALANLTRERGRQATRKDLFTGEGGLTIGSTFPLGEVSSIMAEAIYLDRLRPWVQAHCSPGCRVISREAYDLLTDPDFIKHLDRKGIIPTPQPEDLRVTA